MDVKSESGVKETIDSKSNNTFGREYLTIIYYLLLNADDTAPISKCYRDYIRFAECRLVFFCYVQWMKLVIFS